MELHANRFEIRWTLTRANQAPLLSVSLPIGDRHHSTPTTIRTRKVGYTGAL